jgi:hypothetical protein
MGAGRSLGVVLALVLAGAAQASAAAGSPDLVVRAVSAKGGTVFIGDRRQAKVSVANAGSAAAKKSAANLYLSRDKSWSSADVPVGRAKTPPLAAKASRRVKGIWVPQGSPVVQRMTLLACADDGFKVNESKETNNCSAARSKVTVAPATAFGAIDADLAARKINAEKALTYKLFAGFGDKRLPRKYDVGKETGGDLTAVVDQAIQTFASLSPQTQDTIAPFLMPPAYEGSYAARPTPNGRAQLDQCSVRQPQWTPVAVDVGAGTSAGGAVIWWNSSRPGDEAQANRLAGELAGQIWPKLTALMGTTPLSDAGHSCSGIDGRVDIYLDPIPDPVTSQFNGSCAPSASDIIFPAGDSRGALAHEFMHVLQKTFNRLAPCQQFAYLDDATATWAEDFVYPKDNSEHHYPEMLKFPDIHFGVPPDAGYPAWTLFYSAAKRLGSAVVPAFHTAAQTEPPLEALDSAMTLDAAWPQFARDGWNRALPSALTESFFNWDAFPVKPDTPAQKKEYSLSGKRQTFPLPIDLLGMGRQYQWIDLSDDAAKLVTFIDPAPTDVDPKLQTYAFYKLKDGTWKGEDWTGRDEVEFCRETTDVREVVLVHSTTTPPAGADGGTSVAKTSKPKLRLADNCDPGALYDVTSASGSFNWNIATQDVGYPCSGTRDVHWTAALAPGGSPEPAQLEVIYDRQERPLYLFRSPPPPEYIPLVANATGEYTETCSADSPGSNGSFRCNIAVQSPERVDVGSDDFTRGPEMKMNWFFGFSGYKYDPFETGQGGNGGKCTYSGPRPPFPLDGTASAGLFVASNNDGENGLEPVGISTSSVSAVSGDSVTLSFSGSGGNSFADDLETGTASWDYAMTVSYTRR